MNIAIPWLGILFSIVIINPDTSFHSWFLIVICIKKNITRITHYSLLLQWMLPILYRNSKGQGKDTNLNANMFVHPRPLTTASLVSVLSHLMRGTSILKRVAAVTPLEELWSLASTLSRWEEPSYDPLRSKGKESIPSRKFTQSQAFLV